MELEEIKLCTQCNEEKNINEFIKIYKCKYCKLCSSINGYFSILYGNSKRHAK